MLRELGVVEEGKITAIRKLSDLEYTESKKAIMQIRQFLSDQQLYLIAFYNYNDYIDLLTRYLDEYSKNPTVYSLSMDNVILEINRYILNYLSSVRTFLDHTETNLKKRYGRDSIIVKRFKEACSECQDTSFSFRFISKLRNYAQHCGMPLGRLSIKSKEDPPYSKKVSIVLDVEFHRDMLLTYDKWGSKLKKEIQKLPPSFGVNHHLREMMQCLQKINFIVVEDSLRDLRISVKIVQKLINETKNSKGNPGIFKYRDIKRTPEGKVRRLKIEVEWIPVYLIDFIKSIQGT